MVFSSLLFMFVYLVVTMGVYYLLPRKFRNLWLFIVSIVFYGFGEPVYVLLMIASITVNYVSGLLLERFADEKGKKKLVLVLCVVINLGLLGYFKYAGFAADIINDIPIFSSLAVPEIALPIGISFYTFQAMSYVIDVYRGNCAAQKNYITFGTYVALFPQLIAGPIVRYVDVEYQLMHRRESMPMFTRGVKLFLVGLAKKVLIANQMGVLWEAVKGGSGNGILGSWIGIIAFTLQIYFDFSGYSDMARGLGNMFGFEFVKNFDYPYISKSITEFWRRWHISLGTWFREYVYIPLGGNRKGTGRMVFNLAVVWLLTGLWHGASINFVLWGAYFGLLLIIEKLFLQKYIEKLPAFLQHVYALLFIVLGWVIFDFTDISQMGAFFASLFTLSDGIIGEKAAYMALSYLPLLTVAIFACLPVGKKLYYRLDKTKAAVPVEVIAALIVLVLCTAALVSSSYNPFLYYRF